MAHRNSTLLALLLTLKLLILHSPCRCVKQNAIYEVSTECRSNMLSPALTTAYVVWQVLCGKCCVVIKHTRCKLSTHSTHIWGPGVATSG